MPEKKKPSTRPPKKTTQKSPRSTKAAAARPRRKLLTASPQPDPAPSVSEKQIRERAYQIYLARGAASGDAVPDWLQAKRELRAL